jgi:hypothetical protein
MYGARVLAFRTAWKQILVRRFVDRLESGKEMVKKGERKSACANPFGPHLRILKSFVIVGFMFFSMLTRVTHGVLASC